jgi:hypothetical protein
MASEGSRKTARAKGQTCQALELYEIMNVESVLGGLYPPDAPMVNKRIVCPPESAHLLAPSHCGPMCASIQHPPRPSSAAPLPPARDLSAKYPP